MCLSHILDKICENKIFEVQFLKSSISLHSDYLHFIFPFAPECSWCGCREEHKKRIKENKLSQKY